LFWWPKMKKEVAEFVYACLVCQKSKVEHQKPSDLMQPMFVSDSIVFSLQYGSDIFVACHHSLSCFPCFQRNNESTNYLFQTRENKSHTLSDSLMSLFLSH
jgi:hypothetical protein